MQMHHTVPYSQEFDSVVLAVENQVAWEALNEESADPGIGRSWRKRPISGNLQRSLTVRSPSPLPVTGDLFTCLAYQIISAVPNIQQKGGPHGPHAAAGVFEDFLDFARATPRLKAASSSRWLSGLSLPLPKAS